MCHKSYLLRIQKWICQFSTSLRQEGDGEWVATSSASFLPNFHKTTCICLCFHESSKHLQHIPVALSTGECLLSVSTLGCCKGSILVSSQENTGGWMWVKRKNKISCLSLTVVFFHRQTGFCDTHKWISLESAIVNEDSWVCHGKASRKLKWGLCFFDHCKTRTRKRVDFHIVKQF